MKAINQKQEHTGSYYAATVNEVTDYPVLDGRRSADVCVVGAGFTGVSTALDLAEPTCAVPSCDNPRLEYHHLDRHADMGPTSWWNLGHPCTHCHHQATHHGYRLAGTPGNRIGINPLCIIERADDPTLVGHPPPTEPDPPPNRRPPYDDRDTDDTGIDLTAVAAIEAFDQLVLVEPARAP